MDRDYEIIERIAGAPSESANAPIGERSGREFRERVQAEYLKQRAAGKSLPWTEVWVRMGGVQAREVLSEDDRSYTTYDGLVTLPGLAATMRGVTAGLDKLVSRSYPAVSSLLYRAKELLALIAAAGGMAGPTQQRAVARLMKPVQDIAADVATAVAAPPALVAYDPPVQRFGQAVPLQAASARTFGLVFANGERHG
jgi:hypothetical protein